MQMDPALYQGLSAYNTWMTEKAYETAGGLSDEERKADRGAFFRSIHSTLNHILFADRIWLGRFTGRTYDVRGMGVDICDDFEDLRSSHLAICAEVSEFTNDLTAGWLAGTLEWTSGQDGTVRRRPRWLVVSHMFNHQTHHRGQLTTLFAQAGVDIGRTDLVFMPDVED
ncbi:DUF664 domain-containing protein [Rhodobacterales bacterium]|nr:DUF664 domain-containing protein [Rhodobacterales bacterium]